VICYLGQIQQDPSDEQNKPVPNLYGPTLSGYSSTEQPQPPSPIPPTYTYTQETVILAADLDGIPHYSLFLANPWTLVMGACSLYYNAEYRLQLNLILLCKLFHFCEGSKTKSEKSSS
jgi:hypothetical protein